MCFHWQCTSRSYKLARVAWWVFPGSLSFAQVSILLALNRCWGSSGQQCVELHAETCHLWEMCTWWHQTRIGGLFAHLFFTNESTEYSKIYWLRRYLALNVCFIWAFLPVWFRTLLSNAVSSWGRVWPYLELPDFNDLSLVSIMTCNILLTPFHLLSHYFYVYSLVSQLTFPFHFKKFP